MKIQYFPETDTLAIELTTNSVAFTDAVTNDAILDYDKSGKIVAITIDNCSKNVDAINLETMGVPILMSQ